MGTTEQWACEELGRLGFCDPHVIIRYLQPIEDLGEVREYLVSMLDGALASHTAFIQEFMRRHHQDKAGMDTRFYRKPDLEAEATKVMDKKKQKVPRENYGQKTAKENNGRGQKETSGRMQKEANGRVQKETNGRGQKEIASNIASTPPSTPTTTPSTTTPSSSSKKKAKFVNLYSPDGANKEVVLLSGRHRCHCQAAKHKLVANCLRCGRVVCSQEGSGPCQFCGNLVVTREERELLGRGSKKSEALQRRLMSERNATVSDEPPPEEPSTEALEKAVEQKNRLLEYDRTSERRTRVLDDESDYFSVESRWLSDEDKAKLRQREEELRAKRFSRGGQTITIDVESRRLVADEHVTSVYDPNDPLVKEVLEGRTSDIFSAPDRGESGLRVEVSRPLYQNTDVTTSTTRQKPGNVYSKGPLRLQDRELQEMRDGGLCLSMHQPYASLLIAGIKIHEGRTWYSAHRGRLWIAAAAKIPQQEDTQQLEAHYRVLLNDDNLSFPRYYPAGCLLGCVDVVDVLPQEEYREKFPEGESECPYVFVCQNPQEMVLKFPLKGQHKIFKLDSKVHQTAKKALRPREE